MESTHQATTARAQEARTPTGVLRSVNGDFYDLAGTLSDADRGVHGERGRAHRQRYWMRGEFPFQVIPGIGELNVVGMGYQGYGCPGRGHVLEGVHRGIRLGALRASCPHGRMRADPLAAGPIGVVRGYLGPLARPNCYGPGSCGEAGRRVRLVAG